MTVAVSNDTLTYVGTAGLTKEADLVKVAMSSLRPKVCPVSATTVLEKNASAGAIGDYFDSLLIIPTSTSPGTVQIKDGSATAIDVFVGGASSISTLHSFSLPIGTTSESGAWSVICGANVKAVAVGDWK